jgi:nucleoid DNA-binding protein
MLTRLEFKKKARELSNQLTNTIDASSPCLKNEFLDYFIKAVENKTGKKIQKDFAWALTKILFASIADKTLLEKRQVTLAGIGIFFPRVSSKLPGSVESTRTDEVNIKLKCKFKYAVTQHEIPSSFVDDVNVKIKPVATKSPTEDFEDEPKPVGITADSMDIEDDDMESILVDL